VTNLTEKALTPIHEYLRDNFVGHVKHLDHATAQAALPECTLGHCVEGQQLQLRGQGAAALMQHGPCRQEGLGPAVDVVLVHLAEAVE